MSLKGMSQVTQINKSRHAPTNRMPLHNCSPVQHTATHRNTLPHPATPCNTLTHTDTRAPLFFFLLFPRISEGVKKNSCSCMSLVQSLVCSSWVLSSWADWLAVDGVGICTHLSTLIYVSSCMYPHLCNLMYIPSFFFLRAFTTSLCLHAHVYIKLLRFQTLGCGAES